MFGGFSLRFAEERNVEKPEHVKCRQTGDNHTERKERIISLFQRLREEVLGALRNGKYVIGEFGQAYWLAMRQSISVKTAKAG